MYYYIYYILHVLVCLCCVLFAGLCFGLSVCFVYLFICWVVFLLVWLFDLLIDRLKTVRLLVHLFACCVFSFHVP